MKRREFVTASVLALLAGSQAQAANPVKPSAKPAAKPAVKPAAKSTTKPAPKSRKPSVRPAKKSGKPAVAVKPDEPNELNGSNEPDAPRNTVRLPDEPLPQWRDYELHTTVALKETESRTRLWLPLMQYRDTAWERSFGHRWQGNHETAGIYRDPLADMEVFYADWPEGVAEPKLEIVSRFATQDRHFDITRRGATAERGEILRRCLQATERMPIDGIVRRTAERAIGRIKDPLAQAKALYDWVVENTNYDPRVQAVRQTNLADFLESGELTGDSAALAQLFVGLCRAAGIPARPVFGRRVDRSRLFACLGVAGELNAARHCRAEFHSPGYGWVPVNPSDVRQAVRDENLGQYDSRLTVLKKLLFGFWEMNWVGLNSAQDVLLQGSSGGTLPFLVDPVVETRGNRFADPESGDFSYDVRAERV